jgi:hypothetical protein
VKVVALFFLLLTGTALQAFFPALRWLGHASAPVLGALVVYYTLFRGGPLMLAAALLGGLFQDSLSLIPIGYSSFGFAVGALIIERYREVIVLQSPLTHMVLTSALHAGVTLFLALMLVQGDLIAWQPGWLLLKVAGAAALGLVTGPVIVGLAHLLEEKLGLIEGSSDDEGAKRSYYGIG